MDMTNKRIAMGREKRIALIAHDNQKDDLVEWALFNRDLLAHHTIFATGTTGRILEEKLGFPITKVMSGPLGGDQPGAGGDQDIEGAIRKAL